jgi:hypothetical protein
VENDLYKDQTKIYSRKYFKKTIVCRDIVKLQVNDLHADYGKHIISYIIIY